MTESAPGWNRECVICGHKWMGLDNDNCPACIARCERMWAAASGDMSDSKTAAALALECDRLRTALLRAKDALENSHRAIRAPGVAKAAYHVICEALQQ